MTFLAVFWCDDRSAENFKKSGPLGGGEGDLTGSSRSVKDISSKGGTMVPKDKLQQQMMDTRKDWQGEEREKDEENEEL